MAADCLFCKVAAGDIPAKPVYRDDRVFAIQDINPQAPVHLLVIPIEHHANIGELSDAKDDALVAKLFEVASALGREKAGDGYRLVMNTGRDGGQTVDHLHVHVMGGRSMTWPPG